MRAVAVTLAALALAPSLAGAAPELRSGLRGVVMRGPTKPVCRENELCEEAVGVALRFSRGGHVVARVETERRRTYFIRLRPACTESRRRYAGSDRRSLPTQRGFLKLASARVNFHIDTGIQ